MYETSKTAQVLQEVEKNKLDILGMSECCWTGAGKQITSSGAVILHSGHAERHERCVTTIVSIARANTLFEWEEIGERLIRGRFNSKHAKLTIFQCNAPTNEAEDDDKGSWYEKLQAAISKVPLHDALLITGDINAKLDSANSSFEKAMGRHGCGIMNDNAKRLVEFFFLENNCAIGGTIFPHKDMNKRTWWSDESNSISEYSFFC